MPAIEKTNLQQHPASGVIEATQGEAGEATAFSRNVAETLVSVLVQRYTEYNFKGVAHNHAKALLGESRFAAMLADPIRKLGPVPWVVYPWNVVDYLTR